MNIYMQANQRLAELLGWTNVVEVDGALMGVAPHGTPYCHDHAVVPDWCGDWAACMALVMRQDGEILEALLNAIKSLSLNLDIARLEHTDLERATRYILIVSVIATNESTNSSITLEHFSNREL